MQSSWAALPNILLMKFLYPIRRALADSLHLLAHQGLLYFWSNIVIHFMILLIYIWKILMITINSSINNYFDCNYFALSHYRTYISPMQIIPWGPEGFESCWQMGSVYSCLYHHWNTIGCINLKSVNWSRGLRDDIDSIIGF